MGPKRTQVFANYPGSSNDQGNELDGNPDNGRRKKGKGKQQEDQVQGNESDNNPDNGHKKKGKGKQQEDQNQGNELKQNPYSRGKKRGKGRRREDQLQGLLKMNQSEETPTPDRNGTEHNELVTIDMAQMLQFKDMGYEALGPINGPNEGLPEYQVPKAWVEDLTSHEQSQNAPKLNEQAHDAQSTLIELSWSGPHPDTIDPALLVEPSRSGPHPDTIDPALLVEPSQSGPHPDNIDPALLAQHSNQIARRPDHNSHTSNEALPLPDAGQNPLNSIQHSSNEHPNTNPNNDAVSVPDSEGTQNKRLSTGGLANLRQTQSTNKRKKLTADDRAALEAQQMGQSGARRRSKLTWGK